VAVDRVTIRIRCLAAAARLACVGESSRTTAELIVECLENEGVTHVFGRGSPLSDGMLYPRLPAGAQRPAPQLRGADRLPHNDFEVASLGDMGRTPVL
jgi:hypothetical protein